MSHEKIAAIAGVVLSPLALMLLFSSGEPDPVEPMQLPAAVPLAELTSATTTTKATTTEVATTEAIPEQPKEEAKGIPPTPKAAEPKAFFRPPAEEKPRSASPKPTPVPVSGTGGDRDCPDFASQGEAQRFFIANGGPASDPHKLDRDDDGIACES